MTASTETTRGAGMSVDTRPAEETRTEEAPQRVRRRWGPLSLALLVVVTLAVAATAAIQVREALHDREQARARTAVLEVARAQTLNMLSVNPSNVQSRMRSLLASSTGEFRRDFESVQASFGAVVTKGQVVSEAHVVSSAVAELDDDDARVLLAVDSEVRNGKRHETRTRQYRLIADLTRKGEQWLISGMRFVA
jgi:Mce-associated membrane protein